MTSVKCIFEQSASVLLPTSGKGFRPLKIRRHILAQPILASGAVCAWGNLRQEDAHTGGCEKEPLPE